MRRAHDPSGLRGRCGRHRRDAQQQRRDAGAARRQRQLAAGDQIELAALAKTLQHHAAQRVAGERVRGGAQSRLDIGRPHRDEAARIEPEFVPATHCECASLALGKILPDPQQRPVRADAPRQPCDEAGRRGTLASLAEHLVQRAARQPSLQCSIGLGMPQWNPIGCVGIRMRLDAFDAAAQMRKRVRAIAAHASLLEKCWQIMVSTEPMIGPIVHDMF